MTNELNWPGMPDEAMVSSIAVPAQHLGKSLSSCRALSRSGGGQGGPARLQARDHARKAPLTAKLASLGLRLVASFGDNDGR